MPPDDPAGNGHATPPTPAVHGMQVGQFIELSCPDCGHVQREPSRVVSTQCRVCRSHYQVRDGRAVLRPRPVTRLAKPGQHEKSAAVLSPPKPRPGIGPPRRPVPPPPPWWRRLLFPLRPPRDVLCFGCGHHFQAGGEAESTQCPRCGAYASLRNYEIREPWSRPLQTRGNVTVHKEGSVHQANIQCHHLTLHGRMAAPVECSGDIEIFGGGKFTGTVSCRNLRVRRRVRVDFLDPVKAANILIEGEARGCFHCTGTVTLAKHGKIHGLVRAAELVIRPGALHDGTFDPVAPSPARSGGLAPNAPLG